jgi:hypothetical protein
MNWKFWQKKAPPPPPPEARMDTTTSAAYRLALERVTSRLKIPDSRQSQENSSLAQTLSRFEERYSGYPADTAKRIQDVLRWLVQMDEDASGAVRDLVVLANAGHSIEFVGGARAVKTAQAEVEAWSETIYPEGGGIDGLINNQIREPIITGASSCEWYPAKNRKSVAGVAVVTANRVRIARNPETQQLEYYQTQTAVGDVLLHPMTHRYLALQTDGDNPQGVPLLISSLEALERKGKLLNAQQRVIEAMSKIALVSASIPEPEPAIFNLTSKGDPKYQEALGQFFAQVADLITAGSERGLYLAPTGAEIKLTNVAKSGDGSGEIIESNDRRVWTALRTLPFMRGRMDSTTQALAQIVYPILEAEAASLQMLVAKQLEFGINLHLRLRGIPARAWVRFNQAKSPFAKDAAETMKTRLEAHKVGMELLGADWLPKVAAEFDVTLGDDRNQIPADVLEEMLNAPEPKPAHNSLVFDKSRSKYERS